MNEWQRDILDDTTFQALVDKTQLGVYNAVIISPPCAYVLFPRQHNAPRSGSDEPYTPTPSFENEVLRRCCKLLSAAASSGAAILLYAPSYGSTATFYDPHNLPTDSIWTDAWTHALAMNTNARAMTLPAFGHNDKCLALLAGKEFYPGLADCMTDFCIKMTDTPSTRKTSSLRMHAFNAALGEIILQVCNLPHQPYADDASSTGDLPLTEYTPPSPTSTNSTDSDLNAVFTRISSIKQPGQFDYCQLPLACYAPTTDPPPSRHPSFHGPAHILVRNDNNAFLIISARYAIEIATQYIFETRVSPFFEDKHPTPCDADLGTVVRNALSPQHATLLIGTDLDRFRFIVNYLIHVTSIARPDMIYTTGLLASAYHRPTLPLLHAAVRAAKYLYNTRRFGIRLPTQVHNADTCSIDASYVRVNTLRTDSASGASVQVDLDTIMYNTIYFRLSNPSTPSQFILNIQRVHELAAKAVETPSHMSLLSADFIKNTAITAPCALVSPDVTKLFTTNLPPSRFKSLRNKVLNSGLTCLT